MNRTIKAAIRCFINQKQDDRDESLPQIAGAIRAAVNRHTGFTPDKMMLGREVNTPAELMFPGTRKTSEPDEYVNQLQTNIELAHNTARQSLKTELKRSKRDYDLKKRVREFSVGDAVYYLDQSSRVGQNRKLRPVYIGPAVIEHAITPYIFQVNFRNRDVKVVNHDCIKLCNDRDLPQWINKRQKELRMGLEKTYCICNKPDDGFMMIQCDSCLEWFHCACVHITKHQAGAITTYICPIC